MATNGNFISGFKNYFIRKEYYKTHLKHTVVGNRHRHNHLK